MITGLIAGLLAGPALPGTALTLLDPDAPEAQRWVRDELAKAPYQAAQPTWFDRLSQSVLDWLASLTAPDGGAFSAWVPVIVVVIVIAVLGAAWLIFGAPRLNRRSRLGVELFGDDDRRSAEDMRRAAADAALRADWSLASTEIFRALARGLAERTVLSVSPGTTAHDFAGRAAQAFPFAQVRLSDAARVFDEVRYLGRPGTEAGYRELLTLERELSAATPSLLETPALSVPR
ncbi:DUF4129 domain-containing protein [Cryobacterium frigoriphilum]|uniref:DUF4129 domain-containing protein n=1 Tax=Cryobacterium frigoriphilum TaxID=1259150 RepID=A0A4R8ZYP9_9MICO|nr:DUF4129 domain-containing protein [Cryobacterium frigoriphilum]TFD49000.1 DUF4129 domain-containing protein [Cryobacterium frigoriphilum]